MAVPKCSICRHPGRDEIDRRLLAHVDRKLIAADLQVSADALNRHWRHGHVAVGLAKSHDAAEIASADRLLAEAQALLDDAKALRDEARAGGSIRDATPANNSAIRALELLAKVAGILKDEVTVNVIGSPQWIEIRTVIVQALEPYPEAREAVSDALTTRELTR